MRIFTPANVANMDFVSVVRRPEKVGAIQINDDFQVPQSNGDLLEGEPGDYLLCGVDDRLSVVKRVEFDRLYRPFNPDFDR